MDVGHGQGSFVWEVAKVAAKKSGFWPDVISSDLHTGNVGGPAHDLAHVASKMLRLGMPLSEESWREMAGVIKRQIEMTIFLQVIQAMTSTPAKAISKQEVLGSLRPGCHADITIFHVET